MIWGGKDTPNRRKVLGSIGFASVSSLSGISATAAESNATELSGISYDTLTHTSGTEVRGSLIDHGDGLRGNVNIAGYTLPLKELVEIAPRNNRLDSSYIGVFTDDRYRENGYPLKVKVDKVGDSYSGVLSRPSNEFGDLGFYITSPDIIDIDQELNRMNGTPKWSAHSLSFDVPNKGLPRGTASARFIEYERENGTERRNRGDQR